MSEFHGCFIPSNSLAILQASLIQTLSHTSPALFHEESWYWFHTLNPMQKFLCLKSLFLCTYLSYQLELPTLKQSLRCMPEYPSKAEMLVDRTHSSQKLLQKYMGTLSPINVLGEKGEKVGGGVYDQMTLGNKPLIRSQCVFVYWRLRKIQY